MRTRFLADMNISPKTVAALQQAGWDIVRVSQRLPGSASDDDVIALARQEQRVLLTQDLDFSTLIALSGATQPSLVTLRLLASDPESVTQRLLDVLPRIEDVLTEGCAVTVEETVVRVRRLPIA